MKNKKISLKLPTFRYNSPTNESTFDLDLNSLSLVFMGKSYDLLNPIEQTKLIKLASERGVNTNTYYSMYDGEGSVGNDVYSIAKMFGINDKNHTVKKLLSEYIKSVENLKSKASDKFKPKEKEDTSDRIRFDNIESEKAKYFNTRYVTKNMLKEIDRVGNKYGIDKYKLLSALMIDAPSPATSETEALTANHYYNTHNILDAYIPPIYNTFNANDPNFIFKQLGLYNDKNNYSEKIVRKRIDDRINNLKQIIDSIEPSESLLENHARFIYKKGFESVNPAQKGLTWKDIYGNTYQVKYDYVDQVFDGANAVKKTYPNLFDFNDESSNSYSKGGFNIIPGRRKKYDFGGVQSENYYKNVVAYGNDENLYEHQFFKEDKLYDAYKSGDIDLNAKGIAKANQLMARDSAIYANMQNKINNEILTSRKKYNFGGIRSTHDATADYLGMARDSGNRFFGNGIIDMLYHGGTNDDTGIPVKNYVDKLIANDKLIYANMQNKINNEVLTSRGITAKFGGLVGIPRRKFYWGGTSINDPGSVQWGTRVQASDIDESKYSADGESIVGGSVLSGAGTGLGIGAAVGGTAALATGAAAGSWLGPIGAGIGALIGGIVGLFTGRKKKRQEERRRQKLLAEQAEMERQQTLGNMQDKVENDVATIRQSNLGNYSEGTGFYAKLGGMIGRRKLNTGGQIVPNSSNSVVAYGQTHEQYNPATGETGIIYGDSEIEGGGAKNGRMYAGEVVRETSEGGQVFSDTIKVPGTNRTFADYAKKLTDMKGKKEAQVIQLADGITLSLSALDKSKTNKLQTGTNVRNIEKLVYKMNKARGESEAIDVKTEDLFEAQELYATALGLRNDAPVMRCGGMVRKKRPFGGYASPYSLTGVSAPKLTTLPPIQTTASAGGGSAFKFGFNEFGLGMNLASSLFGIVGNALNTRANRKAIEFESTLHVPKGNKVDAVQYSTDYDISEELQELGTQERRAARYITDNTSNVQTARNSVANLAINAQLARNKLYGAKKDYQRQRYDLNRQERVNARNTNSQIMYQDAINEYNKAVGLNQQLMAVRTQGLQGMLQGVESLAGAVNNYASARLYEKLWPRGVTNHMRSGFACGGLARRKRA